MPGYAANLVRSGARGLTTRRRSYAAATLSTMLRSTPANEPRSEAPGVAAGEPTPTAVGDRATILGPSVTRAHRVETSGAAFQSRSEVSAASPPSQTSRATEERDPSVIVAAMQPEPWKIPSAPPHAAATVSLRPGPAKTADNDMASVVEDGDARRGLSAAAILPQHRPIHTGDEENARRENLSGSSPIMVVTEKQESEILPPQPATDSTKHGFYHGRRIRVEHSTTGPNPTVVGLQQRSPATPAPAPAVLSAKEHAPPGRSGEQAHEVPSRSTPRITAPAQANAHLPAVAGSKPETAARSSVFSVLPAAAAPEPAFTPAAKRNSAREERTSDGPRLSIGLLEVQIIQEPSEAPQTRTPTRSPAHEHDDLERSYVRSIG